MAAMTEPYIVVTDLEKRFRIAERDPGLWGAFKGLVRRRHRDVFALHGVSFEIQRGELVGYIGPNGAGKSTTIKILSGILVPSGGRVQIDGRVPWQDRVKHVAGIGVVFGQRTQLWWDLPVIESLELLRDIYRVPEERYRRTRDELVALLDLESLLDVPVRQLSLGQRMRCDLAASLVHEPEILFLDEPTIGLDAVSKLAMRDFVIRQNRERETTVLLTTHVVDFQGEPILDQAHSARVSARAGERITFEVAGRVADFVAEITAAYAVHDLTVVHPPIEETVAALYQSAHKDRLAATEQVRGVLPDG
jgi:ABC-2 type transport system ATP-binding protein